MVDLKNQYLRLKKDIDIAIKSILDSCQFIKGDAFINFQEELANYLNVSKVIPCANGTDALQIAMMALNLKKGDEVIVPAFTYVATAEVIGLLGLKPVMVDVDPDSFNVTSHIIEEAISNKTKLIVPVHLFGQCTDLEPILEIARRKDISIIEDTAQAIGSKYSFSDGTVKYAGTIGDIGTTSFFPSKNLGCYGDGGALFANDLELAEKIRMIANHGQSQQYVHDVIGINSRLDGLQAAILRVKLKHLSDFEARRNIVADYYDMYLNKISNLQIPFRQPNSTHVFHQYTIKVKDGLRDGLKKHLAAYGIPSMVYYPKPLHKQSAFKDLGKKVGDLKISQQLCDEVLSLPIHTEFQENQLEFIVDKIRMFFDSHA
ncbi:DegT/DnrJ/EryC1/StrS family aminotransferase [Lacihabitans sp. CS3-21]|nr:DegT/DnrJ/EryC1/StrS family aminotransferase [Lacihabitans sp. CS3-21]